MELLTGGTVPWLTLRGIERNPEGARAALHASPVAYLVRPGHAEALDKLAGAPASGTRILEERNVGRFRLVVTDRPVPGVAAPSTRGPRALQVAAAVAAGLLFAGVFIAVGRLGRPRDGV
jgi:hypothetical protein